jgi:hypothetical protein
VTGHDDWMSPQQAAAYLGVTTAVVYRLINDGTLLPSAFRFASAHMSSTPSSSAPASGPATSPICEAVNNGRRSVHRPDDAELRLAPLPYRPRLMPAAFRTRGSTPAARQAS